MALTTPKTEQIAGYFTPEEKEFIQKAARVDSRTVSSLLRVTLLREAKRVMMAHESQPSIADLSTKELA